MKKSLNFTFGTMLAVSMAAPIAASAYYHDAFNHLAGWIEVTYMQPSNNGLSVGDYAMLPTDIFFDGMRNHYFLDPKSDFDYAFGFSYRIPHSHTRFFLNYDHIANDRNRDGDINLRNLGITPVAPPLAQTQSITDYHLKEHEFRVGAIHDLHFGDHFCLDLLAFMEFSRVKQEFNEFITRDSGANVRTRETENLVKAFGPGVGFMTRWYSYNPHWHVFAGGNTTLLRTDNSFHQTFNVIHDNIIDSDTSAAGSGYHYEPYGTHSIVGKMDIEFGINYHCALRREMHGARWDVSLGMRYMNMFNVFKNGNTMWQPLPTTTGQASNYDNFPAYLGAAQDWGKFGPFLRFTLGGHHS